MSEDSTSPLAARTVSAVFAASDHGYFLVVTDRGAHRVVLPMSGTLLVGRDPTCGIHLDEAAVSREHARVTVRGGTVTLEDLGSHNGTRLAGARLEAPRALQSGDVVSIGTTTLVACLPATKAAAVRLLDPDELRAQIHREVIRARTHDRPLALICATLDAPACAAASSLLPTALRVIDVAGQLDPAHLYVLCPELPRGGGARRVAELVAALSPTAPGIKAAIAHLPSDAVDATTLIATALARVGAADSASAHDVRRVGDLEIIVADPAMRHIYDLLERLGRSDLPVLVCGESGVGKELAARTLHAASPRNAGPFVAVNCAALPAALAESELFGHRRGAFSGADRDKAGYFAAAAGGTLFLDELGELDAAVQGKLLRAVETRTVVPLGATTPVPCDVRLVSATNRDVPAEIDAGRFRRDLFYRLSAATVVIPPLRDRPRELPMLARALLARACASSRRAPLTLSDLALAQLATHPFPGNIRELANAVAYAAAVAGDDDELLPHHLPPTIAVPPSPGTPRDDNARRAFRPIADELVELERRRMREALDATGGNQSRAAELIDMPRRTFTKKMARYGLRGHD
ncbi:MAG: sigma 54-interacting transcriptional regulator [Kofleriaceae bacterium]